ncbi:hypothetical protein LEP1GSC050_4227 [Leptospira broomii serovar Hurstbridge str. 5399]|uniref:Uncharacterized protein n=1 Tax=Leptospira broomii serovar Hurstbridge str. 5399 TaxID=1049789 RepID=T0FDS2_9LEPT|nr:hypothetical protein [Leptospira broomii]EQA45757.1 hypothetical protein LEP1GSC050_4227 [Leptospira broomii serovar Hurstbridge str. 5399]
MKTPKKGTIPIEAIDALAAGQAFIENNGDKAERIDSTKNHLQFNKRKGVKAVLILMEGARTSMSPSLLPVESIR